MDSSVLPASRHSLNMSISPVLQISLTPPTHPRLTSVHRGTQPPILDETLVPSKKSSTVEKPGALSHFVLKLPFLYTFTLKIFALRGHYLPRADVRGGQLTPHWCFQRARSASPCPLRSPIPGSSAQSSDLTACQPEGDLAEQVGRRPGERQGLVPAYG